jgi:hypothetical protein
MTITKKHNGIEISTIYKGYLVKRLFIGYTIRESRELFKEYLRTL